MCGIAGILGNQKNSDSIAAMVQAMHRRGPDDSGIWNSKDGEMHFGHARLSIIDLSEGGHQPMTDESGRYTLVFNGEIFNYLEIRSELIKLGNHFRTDSDTEVILNGWRQWGEGVIPKLRGMFAFGIWDDAEAQLTLVRDRMGIKPLLYAESNATLYFASSLNALLASGGIQKKVCKEALWDLLSVGSVMQPRTMVAGVKSLAPGDILIYRNQKIQEIKTYWKLERDPELFGELSTISYKDQVVKLRSELEEACMYHMIADVPVGSFLSGGVDSSVITAIMARLSEKPIQSFSIGFENYKGLENEISEAAEAAKFLNCEHHELILEGKQVDSSFDDFIRIIDQPSYDGINMYWVSKMTSQSVKVALTGLGGDELFAGYSHFQWSNTYANPEPIGSPINALYRKYSKSLARLYPLYMQTAGAHGRLATLRRLNYDSDLRQYIMQDWQTPRSKGDWVMQNLRDQNVPNQNDMDTITRFECKNYLLNTLLRDADALSMGHGLEVRPILLDHRLVEFALALPNSSKLRENRSKAILKDACDDLLPKGFFERKKKGFTLPTTLWLQHDLKDRLHESFDSDIARSLFSKEYLEKTVPHDLSQNRGLGAWMGLVLIEWLRQSGLDIE